MHRVIAGKLTGPVTKWIVAVTMIVMSVGLGFLGLTQMADVKDNEASSWVPASAESTRVANELSDDLNPNDIPTLVVYHREGGLTEADFAAMDDQATQIAELDGVTDQGVLTPNAAAAAREAGQHAPDLVSEDGEVAYTYFVFNFGKDGWNAVPDPVNEIKDFAELEGADVYVGGFGGQAADFAESFEGSHVWLILATLVVVVIILLVTYRSALLWLLPIVAAVMAFLLSEGVVYLLAKYADVTVNDQSQYILGILVIGAGTDYALLLVARYREELRRHEDRHEAMSYALHRAAPALIASAATVAVGLMCLTLADLNSTSGLGPVLAAGVVATLLVMLTLLPALLVIFGRWIFGPQKDEHRTWVIAGGSAIPAGIVAVVIGGVLASLDNSVLKGIGGLASLLGGLAAFLGILALIQVGIEHWTKVHTRPDFGSTEPTTRGLWSKVGKAVAPRPRAVWVVTATVLGIAWLGLFKLDATGLTTEESFTKEFGSITAQKLMAEHGLADNSNTLQVVTDEGAAPEAQAAVAAIEGVGRPSDLRPLGDGRVWFEAPLSLDMASHDAWDIVEDARSAMDGLEGADALVGGAAAFYLDTAEAADRDNKVIIPIVLVVVFLILVMLLRALVAPLLLLGTVVLSFGAALGISALIFTYVFGFEGADPGFPLFAFVFLVALGIDYNIFLMTRVREETLHRGTREGSLVGLASTGGVITSAGIVLAATFTVLGLLPFVFLAELGTAVALGVLLDTMIVRSVLVTALNLDLGSKIWWPSKLDRGAPVDPTELEEWSPAQSGV